MFTCVSSFVHVSCELQGNDRGDWLKNLKYGVFELGNRQYVLQVAKVVDDILVEQGLFYFFVLIIRFDVFVLLFSNMMTWFLFKKKE